MENKLREDEVCLNSSYLGEQLEERSIMKLEKINFLRKLAGLKPLEEGIRFQTTTFPASPDPVKKKESSESKPIPKTVKVSNEEIANARWLYEVARWTLPQIFDKMQPNCTRDYLRNVLEHGLRAKIDAKKPDWY